MYIYLGRRNEKHNTWNMFLHLNHKPHWLHLNKHLNQYKLPAHLSQSANIDCICRYELELILNHEWSYFQRAQTRTHAYCHLLCSTDHAGSRSRAQRGRVECVVWPSTQMSTLHCGERGEKRQRDSRVKLNLNAFVNHRENAVCVCRRGTEEGENRRRRRDGARTRERERQAACVFVRYRD